MNTTSSQLPICVHCGTPRPADETLCPTCGKPWIDTTIQAKPETGATPPAVAPATDTDADTGHDDAGTTAGAVAAAAAVAGVTAAHHTDNEESDDDSRITEATDSEESKADNADEATRNETPAVATAAAVTGVTASHHTDNEKSDDDSGNTQATNSEESNADNADEATRSETPAVATAAAVAGVTASHHTDNEKSDDDSRITEAPDSGGSSAEQPPAAAPPPPPPFGPDDTGEFAFDAWTQPAEEEPEARRAAWLVPAGIAAAILAAIAFLVFGGNNAPSTTTVAAVDTTVAAVTTTSASITTTTQAPTTTAIVFPLPGDWPPKGEPIDIADLTLKQSAIGPIDIGMPIADVAGMLTASLGEATGSGIDGLCPPDESYWLQFGQLTALFDGFDPSSVFVSYRYDEPQGTDPELGLKTLSGIAIGNTVEDLINTYTQFTISFEIIDSEDFFRLSDGGDLLLWGPVSSADPAGLIEGIYSPTACDTAP